MLLRRLGYLFYGPPGTGKSSLAFSLASHFGLPVYLLNLSTPALSDSDLEELFMQLPFHCIIVLEDIDATKPLQRDLNQGSPQPEATAIDSSDKKGDPPLGANRPPGMMKAEEKSTKNTVTLSGLLNAIDGVGATEGTSREVVWGGGERKK